jgi:phospholipid-transporting ATPase
LLNQETGLIYLVDDRREKLKETIRYHLNSLGNRKYKENEIGLILDGKVLQHALAIDMQSSFLELLVSCKTVICCRATPKNKAQIVEFIKVQTKSVTLAIGDGANDVSMIQAAHVGVGIFGREGTQALSASDYAIGKFRFLAKLLFVHGIWNYKRLCKVILYSFYKNICLYVIELWFALSNGFSGQILFERWLISFYNVMFTAWPPLALGLFDRPSKASTMLRFPELYKITQNKADFNLTVFWTWMFNSFIHSILIYFICYGIFKGDVVSGDGKAGDYLFLGTHVYSFCVIVVCLKSGLETDSWTWLTHMSIWGSIGFWFLFLAIYSQLWPVFGLAPDMTGMFQNVFGTPIFWLSLILVPILTLAPDITAKAIQRTVYKTDAQAIQENEINNQDVELVIKMSKRLTETARLLKSAFSFTRVPAASALPTSRYRGYAFSQEEHGAVTQADLIRTYNSKDDKPSGN